jgi:hypothetical protein
VSIVQGFLSSHEFGQSAPSHFSLPSFTPLRHIALQSESLIEFAPGGQHPSPGLGCVIGLFEQAAVHSAAVPIRTSMVQGSRSLQALGQSGPSHNSAPSFAPFPQTALQSESLVAFAVGGQHVSLSAG